MRCFFAAWPDVATRAALATLCADVALSVAHRRITRPGDLHLTLVFIGELADADAIKLARAAKATRFVPFVWQLNLLGFFEPANVVWAGGEAVAPLLDLADQLRTTLDEMSVSYDARPLVPHVTLLRGVNQFAAQRIDSLTWRVDSVALYGSNGSGLHSRYTRVPY